MNQHPNAKAQNRRFAKVAFAFAGFFCLFCVPAHAAQSQSIRFDSLPILSVAVADYEPLAEASSGLAVTLASSDTLVASVVGGKLRAKKAGWTLVTASQGGNGVFDPAPNVTQLLWVVNRPRTLSLWGKWDPLLAGPIFLPDSLRHDIVDVSGRIGTLAALRADGLLFVHGIQPQLAMAPQQVRDVARIRVSLGGRTLVAVRKDGSIQDWGGHRLGYAAGTGAVVPDSLNRGIVDVQILTNYGIVQRADGTTFGIDTKTRTAWETPAEVRSDVVSIAMSYADNYKVADFVFLKRDGSVRAWNRDAGWTALPDSMKTGIRSIAAGLGFIVVVDKNGRAMEWSRKGLRPGVMSRPPVALLSSGVSEVDVDGEHVVAQKEDGSVVLWGAFGIINPVPDSLKGGTIRFVAINGCGYAALGMLKPTLEFTPPARRSWGDGDFEAGLVLQKGRAPVFSASDTNIAQFVEGRILVKHAGTTQLTVNYPGDSLWLAAGPITRSLVVDPKRIVVEAQKSGKVFGEKDPELSYLCSQCGIEDTLTGALSRAPGEGVGTYAIQQGSLNASSDHQLVFFASDFVVGARGINVYADSVSKLAGASDPALTYRVDGLLPGDHLTGGLARDPGEMAGTYRIRQGSLDAGANYTLSFQEAGLLIQGVSAMAPRLARGGSPEGIHATVRRAFVERAQVFGAMAGFGPQRRGVSAEPLMEVLLPSAAQVDVAIFDNAGTAVQNWSGMVDAEAWHRLAPVADGRRRLALTWDLKSRLGSQVADGVYLCRVVVTTVSGSRLEQVLRIGVR